MTHSNKLHGTAGTGKTTRLEKQTLDITIHEDIPLSEVVNMTFRKEKAEELKQEIRNLTDTSSKELRYVGTIHAVCRRVNEDITPDKVVQPKHQQDFCKEFGITYYGNDSEEPLDPYDTTPTIEGNVLFDVYSWLIGNMLEPKDYVLYPGYWKIKVPPEVVFKFTELWQLYKEKHDLYDFSDMLRLTFEKELYPDARIMAVDEFQDNFPLQNKIIEMWSKQMDYVIVAGDPYQSIYGHLGGSPDFFMDFPGKLEVLTKSYRVPTKIWELAKFRLEAAEYKPPDIECAYEGGKVNRIGYQRYISILPNFKNSVFHLVRCNYMAWPIAEALAQTGIPFTGNYGWTQREVVIYNALYKLRANKNKDSRADYRLIPSEVAELIAIFPRDFFNREKSEIIDKVMKPQYPAYTLAHIKAFLNPMQPFREGNFMASVFSPDPFKYALTGFGKFSRLKINHALLNYSKLLSLNDISVYLGTIHSAKGGEADIIFLNNQINKTIARAGSDYPEKRREEDRVFFVGATRAKAILTLVDSPTRWNFEMGVPYNE
jgi:superfamily I DNA/RNA helicase